MILLAVALMSQLTVTSASDFVLLGTDVKCYDDSTVLSYPSLEADPVTACQPDAESQGFKYFSYHDNNHMAYCTGYNSCDTIGSANNARLYGPAKTVQCPASVVNYAGDDSRMQMITGTYSMRTDCERSEGGAFFGGVDSSICFEGPDSFLIWNTGCGWEIGRLEQPNYYMMDEMMWQRHAKTYSGRCNQIPSEGLTADAVNTQTFYNGFGEVISGLSSEDHPSCATIRGEMETETALAKENERLRKSNRALSDLLKEMAMN